MMKVSLLCVLLAVGLASGASIRGKAYRRAVKDNDNGATKFENWLVDLKEKLTELKTLLQPQVDADPELANLLADAAAKLENVPAIQVDGKITKEFLDYLAELTLVFMQIGNKVSTLIEDDALHALYHDLYDLFTEKLPHLPKPLEEYYELQIWLKMLVNYLDILKPAIQSLTEADPDLKALVDHIDNLLANKPEPYIQSPPLRLQHEDFYEWVGDLWYSVSELLRILKQHPVDESTLNLIHMIEEHIGSADDTNGHHNGNCNGNGYGVPPPPPNGNGYGPPPPPNGNGYGRRNWNAGKVEVKRVHSYPGLSRSLKRFQSIRELF